MDANGNSSTVETSAVRSVTVANRGPELVLLHAPSWYIAARYPVKRVLFAVHGYPPQQYAGAELYVERLAGSLGADWECRVVTRCAKEYTRGPVRVFPWGALDDQVTWSDICVTHLDLSRDVHRYCAGRNVPVVHIVHNPKQLAYHGIRGAHGFIFNSHSVESQVDRDMCVPWVVAHPLCYLTEAGRSKGSSIGIVNTVAAKGGHIFWELARAMPHRKFLAVRGGYGPQTEPEMHNAAMLPQTDDMGAFYGRCRTVVVPSDVETYGMVAVEALLHGCAVVCTSTPGLREAVGCHAEYVHLDDRLHLRSWMDAIERVEKSCERSSLRHVHFCDVIDVRNRQAVSSVARLLSDICEQAL